MINLKRNYSRNATYLLRPGLSILLTSVITGRRTISFGSCNARYMRERYLNKLGYGYASSVFPHEHQGLSIVPLFPAQPYP